MCIFTTSFSTSSLTQQNSLNELTYTISKREFYVCATFFLPFFLWGRSRETGFLCAALVILGLQNSLCRPGCSQIHRDLPTFAS